ncbi:MAG: Maf family protein [Armatimonadota bacterium]
MTLALRQPLVLASASPRRQDMLRLAGIAFEVIVSEAEAGAEASGRPPQRAALNARLKALDVAPAYPGRLVVGADTVVALGSTVLEKPVDVADARRMLEQLSGRKHQVYTAFAVVAGGEARVLVEETVESTVAFRKLTRDEIEAYVASGDPLDKAGAYGIQSGGGDLVAEVIGSYLNVVGLPLGRLQAALAALGWTGAAKEN